MTARVRCACVCYLLQKRLVRNGQQALDGTIEDYADLLSSCAELTAVMDCSWAGSAVLSQGCSQNLSSLPDLLVTHPLAAPWLLRRCFSTYGLTMA